MRDAGEQAVAGRAIQFGLQTIGTPRLCPPKAEEQLLRIGQEAVLNAVRHGQPTHLRVSLRYDATAVVLTVSDDGVGFSPDAGMSGGAGHCGLASMHERAQQLGGALHIASRIGVGTDVEAIMPTTQG